MFISFMLSQLAANNDISTHDFENAKTYFADFASMQEQHTRELNAAQRLFETAQDQITLMELESKEVCRK